MELKILTINKVNAACLPYYEARPRNGDYVIK